MSDRLDLRHGDQRVFAHILASSLVVSVANFTVWFAVTFWTYLETRSVTATGLIAGLFLVATASTGIWFGSIVDHHRKQAVIQASTVASCVAYAIGLSLVSVQAWGLLWGVLSAGVIVGGLMVARTGAGANPVRTLLLVNVALWTTVIVFPLRSSIVLLAVSMMAFMLVMPYAEASEQTILQRVVPYHRQGRVFGFAQSVEQAASPLTAFLIAPITEFVVIPFMTDGKGADWIGPWFGTGPDRGMALVFVVTGLIGLVVTLLAFASTSYRRLSAAYAESPAPMPTDGQTSNVTP